MRCDAYIVNWKDTTLGEDNVFNVECGTCDVAYKDINNAKDKLKELIEQKKIECIDELGYDEKDITVSVEDDYGVVNAGSNTYEFSIYGIDIL